jgi:hypothetical protein
MAMKNKMAALLIFLLSPICLAQWDTSISIEEVAKSERWLKLLHYEPAWTTDYKSLVDGPEFFFAPNGKTHPAAELKASLEAMSKNILVGKLKQHPQCAFPYRFQFLQEVMKLDVPKMRCELFDKFIDGFHDPRSISIVYSSAYPNNPASMFGHLLIKVNSERNNPLMDSGVNYAAVVPDEENPFAFFYFGVFGGYRGSYTHQPYYVKVNKYVSFESRDLWEYELTLTKEETLHFLAHIWEIETNSYYWYYFFDENCAFQIMKAIEAIKPHWDISQHNVYAIPGEMIKNLAFTPGAVQEVHFRPSHYNQAQQVLGALNKDEEATFSQLVSQKVKPAQVTSRLSLDAAIAYIEYMRNEKRDSYNKKYVDFRDEVLSARAKLGPLSQDEKDRMPDVVKETRPDEGHDASSVIPGFGISKFSSEEKPAEFMRVRLKSSYHDLLNKDRGLTRYGKIEFPSLEFRYYPTRDELLIEEFGLLKSTSLHPISALSQKYSWKMDSRVATAKDYGCLTCRHFFGESGFGGSLNLWNRRHIAYGLGTIQVEASSRLPHGYRLGPGLDIGLIFNPEDLKVMVRYQRHWYLNAQKSYNAFVDQYQVGAALHLKRNWEIRQTGTWVLPSHNIHPQHFEALLSTQYFFN